MIHASDRLSIFWRQWENSLKIDRLYLNECLWKVYNFGKLFGGFFFKLTMTPEQGGPFSFFNVWAAVGFFVFFLVFTVLVLKPPFTRRGGMDMKVVPSIQAPPFQWYGLAQSTLAPSCPTCIHLLILPVFLKWFLPFFWWSRWWQPLSHLIEWPLGKRGKPRVTIKVLAIRQT